MRNRVLSTLFGVVTAGVLVGCGGGGDASNTDAAPPPAAPPAASPPAAVPPAAVELPEGVTQEMVTQGQTIFTGAGLCQSCHGPDGSGTALAPSLRDQEWLNIQTGSYDEIVNLVNTGVAQPQQAPAPMPPKGGSQITDEQVRQVAAYVYSLSRGG
jgi:mono/diheme cytochrome c family protein